MNNNKDFELFSASSVKLEGSNLIEASAGTGKTYSIAILVLRLVLEQKLSLKEILMVTFTKAAVAELEERIRLFIKKAYKVSLGEPIDDETIIELVHKCAAHTSLSEVQQQLREAVLFLDETSVLTIHSFCQQTLTEFAFETNQLFGAETLQDPGTIILEEVNKFWRQNVTTIPADLLRFLIEAGLTRESIKQVVQEHLNGKKYFYYEADKTYGLCEEDQHKLIAELKAIKQKEEQLRQELNEYLLNNAANLRKIAEGNSPAKKAKIHEITDPEVFIETIIKKRGSAYIQQLYAEVLGKCDDCDKVLEDIKLKIEQAINDTNCQAINAVTMGMEEYKQRNNLLSFEDMIVNLHKALTERENVRLVDALQQKYKAVFVDEFQDTDRLQYEIFQKAFGTNTILFLIGDPKQSIYAWRKADIHTYFKAQSDVEHCYTMNQNFRSAEPLIDAMNNFFKPEDNFDTFHFNNTANAIIYRNVDSPQPNTKGLLFKGQTRVVPISIAEVEKKDEICKAVAAQIIDLLSNLNYKIVKDGKERSLTPSDIGILVRTKGQGRDIKATLAHYCIPAVTIDDTKVLQSGEASWLLYLLEAMIDISRASINKALLSPFTGYKPQQILQLDDEVTLALFRKYQIRWKEDGVYTALIDFVGDFNVRGILLNPNTESGERIIANLFQLIELVHKVQTNKQFSPLELVSWLKRGIEGMETEGDEYEQRVESDEESVKIVTIHKSKGLEYKIVFAPFLDFVENKTFEFYSFREPVTGQYISIEKSKMSEEHQQLVREQNEQENRRLLYVAITRAVYKCFITHCTGNYYKNSTLSYFVSALKQPDASLIQYEEVPPYDEKFRYRQEEGYKPLVHASPVHFELQHNNWMKMSYSMLARKAEVISRPHSSNQAGKYDQFMFNQLVRGSKTGNLLHYIFENVYFTDDRNWRQVIEEGLKQHLPKHSDLYVPMLLEMLQQTFHVPITVNESTFQLSEVSFEKRIHEFEFDFPVPPYQPLELNSLSNDDIEIRVSWDKSLEGVMNGKMDLFFECRGKYYILDWKSNYLGDSLADYSPDALAAAMNESNYHLQYLLYTLAAKKYLQNRLPNFDYEQQFGGVVYLFIRGVRSNSNTGIYTNRPTKDQLELLESILEGEVAEDR
jgi:exodeoxyribonuclease V beta subunit